MDPARFYAPDQPPGAPADARAVRRAEAELGLTFPAAYVELLFVRDGGEPLRPRCPTDFRTSWAPDHFEMDELPGVGGPGTTVLDGPYLVGEWDYPDVGPVVGCCPSGGHDVVMLDYTACGPHGEPSVLYVDENGDGGWNARTVAPDFRSFADRLTTRRTEGPDS